MLTIKDLRSKVSFSLWRLHAIEDVDMTISPAKFMGWSGKAEQVNRRSARQSSVCCNHRGMIANGTLTLGDTDLRTLTALRKPISARRPHFDDLSGPANQLEPFDDH